MTGIDKNFTADNSKKAMLSAVNQTKPFLKSIIISHKLALLSSIYRPMVCKIQSKRLDYQDFADLLIGILRS